MKKQSRHNRRYKSGKETTVNPHILKKAKAKVKGMGFKTKKVDATEKFLRFRQENPKKFDKFRTIDSGAKGKTKLVIGIDTKGTKKTSDDESKVQSVLIKK